MSDWGFVASLVLARIAFGYQFQSLASLGPELVAQFGLGYASLGTLIGLYMAPGVFLAFPGGLLGRRFGSRVLVGAGLGLMAGGAFYAALDFNPAGIGVGRVISGMGAVALIVMQGKMIGDRFGGPRFMPVMGLLTGAFPVGVGMVALTKGGLLAVMGPPGLFLAGGAMAVVSLLLFVVSVRDQQPTGPRWSMPSRRECVLVVIAGLVWTAYNAGYYGFLSYLPSLLAARSHSVAVISAVLTIATWCNLPATVLGGAMAARWGNGRVFLVGTVAGVVAVAGPAFADWPFVWGILFGTAASIHAGVILAVGTLSARPENRAVGMGLFYTTYYIGGAMLPAVCGGAADYAGTPAGALVAGALLSALAAPFYGLHRLLQRRWA